MAVLRSQKNRAITPPDPPDERCFPLLKLPAELRLTIYRMCLKRDRPVLLHLPRHGISYYGEEEEEDLVNFARDNNRLPMVIIDHELPRATRSPNANGSPSNVSTIGNDQPLIRTKSEHQAILDSIYHMDNVNRDPLVVNILRLNKQIYREARPVLYADNDFAVRLDSALHTLTSLHQRSRSLIKQIHIVIHSHHDILEGFADLVRLGLRYCWGLKLLHLKLTSAFPDDGSNVRGSSVYANAFHILRWLPRSCKVHLEGRVPPEVERIIRENERNAEILDEKAYQKRQHQMPDKKVELVSLD